MNIFADLIPGGANPFADLIPPDPVDARLRAMSDRVGAMQPSYSQYATDPAASAPFEAPPAAPPPQALSPFEDMVPYERPTTGASGAMPSLTQELDATTPVMTPGRATGYEPSQFEPGVGMMPPDVAAAGDMGMDNAFADLVPSSPTTPHWSAETGAAIRGVQTAGQGGIVMPGGVLDAAGYAVSSGYDQLRQGGLSAGAGLAGRALSILNRIDAGQVVPETEDILGYQHMSPEQRREARAEVERQLGDVVWRQRELGQSMAGTPVPAAMERMGQAASFNDAWDAFMSDPLGVIGYASLQSLVASSPSIALGAAGRVLGGTGGLMAGTGLGSAGVEFGSGIIEAIAEGGVNLSDAQAVAAALTDQNFMADVRNRAAAKAAAVGAFDAAGAGLAGVAMRPAGVGGRTGALIEAGPQFATQAGTGMAGEAVGQIAQGEDLKWGPVLLEGVAEAGSAPIDVALARAGRDQPAATVRPDGAIELPPIEVRPPIDQGFAGMEPPPLSVPAVPPEELQPPPVRVPPIDMPQVPGFLTDRDIGVQAGPPVVQPLAPETLGQPPLVDEIAPVAPEVVQPAAAPVSRGTPPDVGQRVTVDFGDGETETGTVERVTPFAEDGQQRFTFLLRTDDGRGIDTRDDDVSITPEDVNAPVDALDLPSPVSPMVPTATPPVAQPLDPGIAGGPGGGPAGLPDPRGSVPPMGGGGPAVAIDPDPLPGAGPVVDPGVGAIPADGRGSYGDPGGPAGGGVGAGPEGGPPAPGPADSGRLVPGTDDGGPIAPSIPAPAGDISLPGGDPAAPVLRPAVGEAAPVAGPVAAAPATVNEAPEQPTAEPPVAAPVPPADQPAPAPDAVAPQAPGSGAVPQAVPAAPPAAGDGAVAPGVEAEPPASPPIATPDASWRIGDPATTADQLRRQLSKVDRSLPINGRMYFVEKIIGDRWTAGRQDRARAGLTHQKAKGPPTILAYALPTRADAIETVVADAFPSGAPAQAQSTPPVEGVEIPPQSAGTSGTNRDNVTAVTGDQTENKPPAEPESESDRLAGSFRDAYAGGRSFASIVEARALAAEILGRKVPPGSQDAKMVDEAAEAGAVQQARAIVREGLDPKATFDRLQQLQKQMPALNVRTSTSVQNQAYSTPLALAYVAQRLAGIEPDGQGMVLEPSAGNGALLTLADPKKVLANELNPERAAELKRQGFDVRVGDATTMKVRRPVKHVVANPPFGIVKDEAGANRTWPIADRYQTTQIDYAISAQALAQMTPDGSAVLIVGGPPSTVKGAGARRDAYNAKQRREFYFWLYNAYNVVDHATVDGKLYAQQGASWPVDVIVIRGAGKSALALPSMKPPRQIGTWDEVGSLLDAEYPVRVGAPESDRVGEDAGGAAPGGNRDADGRGVPEPAGRAPGGPDREGTRSAVGDEPDRVRDGAGGEPGRGDPRPEQPDSVRPKRDRKPGPARVVEPERVAPSGADVPGEEPARSDGQPGNGPDGLAGDGQLPAEGRQPPAVEQPAGRERVRAEPDQAQVAYAPAGRGTALGTLTPRNLVDPTADSLDALVARRGDLTAYVARELGYEPDELNNYFAAEQVDALALALDNIARGEGFILGDQTGIGKGRVVAGLLRYAIRRGLAPVFVTEKPNLYADMYRDLVDIGVDLGGKEPRILMTNANQRVPLDDAGEIVLKSKTGKEHDALLEKVGREGARASGYDVIFTTYSQMQTVGGRETPRQRFLRAATAGSLIALDEAHNAGGDGATPADGTLPRSQFARQLIEAASAAVYSSATYAKRPDSMSLYFKTGMRYAVDNMDGLAPAIARGGVPMQQIVAGMLARGGQYIRRERSFDGVDYDVETAAVDKDAYNDISRSLADVLAFSNFVSEQVNDPESPIGADIRSKAGSAGGDSSTGEAGAKSTNFTSIMHNLIDQMLLAMKAQATVDRVLKAIADGEKPVIAVASTMGSFIGEQADDMNLAPGDEFGLDFRGLLERYLERSRTITVRPPYMKKGEKGEKIRLTDADLGARGTAMFRAAQAGIQDLDLDSLPVSPIDYMRAKLAEAGLTVVEITGRNDTLQYRKDGGTAYQVRPAKETSIAGRRAAIRAFNGGEADVLILNQAGATGLSVHASRTFKDQRRRRMVLAQAEKNIDTHMQMLGRVHRTGQVVAPAYSQLVADIPAERRPAAVLARKMASLNANTTGARSGAMSGKDAPDFINIYGDAVAAALMIEDPELNEKLGRPVSFSDDGEIKFEDAMRKVTGRIPLLPLAEQEEVYARLEGDYRALLEQKDAAGENALEAKTLELDARTVSSKEMRPRTRGGAGPFAEAVTAEKVNVKRLGKPHPSSWVVDKVEERTGTPRRSGEDQQAYLIRSAATLPPADRALRDKARDDFDAMGRKRVAAADSPAKQENIIRRLRAQAARWDAIIRVAPVGRSVRIKTDNGNLYGVVIDVARKGDAKDPLALSTWQVTLALADAQRQIAIPFSLLYTPDNQPSEMRPGDIVIERAEKIGETPVIEAFDQMQTDSREDRWMLTGNILAGFAAVDGRGSIVNFIDDQGNMRSGILMPKDWSLDKHQEEAPVRFTSGQQAMQFLKGGSDRSVRSGELIITTKDGWEVVLTAPASKSRGAAYFLNGRILAAAGRDFVKVGSNMVMRVPASMAPAIIDAIIEQNMPVETTSQQAAARATAEEPRAAAPIGSPERPADVFNNDLDGTNDRVIVETPTERSAIVHRISPEYAADLATWETELQPIVDDILGPGRVELRAGGQLWKGVDGAPVEAGGLYYRTQNLIYVSMAANTPEGATRITRHEAMHAAWSLGLFTLQEIRAMERALVDHPRWREMADRVRGDALYGDMPPDEMAEEVAAYMWQDWLRGKPTGIRLIDEAFARLARLYEAVRSYLRRHLGAEPDWRDLFSMIERGGLRNREGIDGSRSSWAEEGLSDAGAGAMDVVRRDHGQMRAAASEPMAAGIEVVEKRTSRDMNWIERALLRPVEAFRRWPPLQKLVRQGIAAEQRMSNQINRLNKRFDAITGKLSTEQFEAYGALLFEGDSEETTYTREELESENVDPKVIDAYLATRDLVETIGRLVDQHRRSMLPQVQARKAAVIKRMARLTNMTDPEFRKLYGKRARLRARLRGGAGNPVQIAIELDALERDLTALREALPEFADLQAEADRLEARLAQTSVRRREGYVPHKFFGTWRVFVKGAPDPDGNDTWSPVAGEHGFFPSRNAAISAAKFYQEANGGAEMRVEPTEFKFPESDATQLSDRAYGRFVGQVGSMLQLQGQELQDAIKGVARRRFRRRVAGFAQYRHGVAGYSKNIDRVLRGHIGEAVRYIAMDRLKFDAINTMEAMGLSPARRENPDTKVLQDAINAWFRDVNGQKQPTERAVDEWLDRLEATPARVPLAVGAAIAGSLGVAGSWVVGPLLGSYIGYRIYRGIASGGEFKSRAITGAMLGDMAHLKLGAFMNVFSAVVNLSQLAVASYPKLGERWMMVGMTRAMAALVSARTNSPNTDVKLLERADIDPKFASTEASPHLFQKQSEAAKWSMMLFSSAETVNRSVTFLAAYHRAIARGATPGEAMRQGKAMVTETQFHYGAANKPELLRNTFLRVPLQFKNFMVQMFSFMFGLKGAGEIARFAVALLLLAGLFGIPGWEWLDWLVESMTGFSPKREIIRQGLLAQAAGEAYGSIIDFLARGFPAALGVDLSARTGMGDMLPNEGRDFLGPWLGTMAQAVRLGQQNSTIVDQVRNLSPGLGNPLKALEAAADGIPLELSAARAVGLMDGPTGFGNDRALMTNPWKRGYYDYEPTTGELALIAAGGRPKRAADIQGYEQIRLKETEELRKREGRYLDRISAALRATGSDPDATAFKAAQDRILAEAAADKKVKISRDQVRNTIRNTIQDRGDRGMKSVPRELRPEMIPLRDGAYGKPREQPDTSIGQPQVVRP